MCSVDKMLIKGIRSFSPDNDHAIIFPKPLTLIVGRNGAGKTVRRSMHSRTPRISRGGVPSSPRDAPILPAFFSLTFFSPAYPSPRHRQTVIECLKMATTGELPPSARAGQAFIHDPKASLFQLF